MFDYFFQSSNAHELKMFFEWMVEYYKQKP